jgi:hypothetical protein
METLLNDVGTPVELYNGSLQLQTAPVALRLFESTWHHLVHSANALLTWFVRQVSQIMSWEVVEAKLKRVTIADNLEKQMMAAQLMMSQQLSGTTVIRDLGYNWKQEQKQIANESQYEAELQAKTQEEMQQGGFAQQIAKGQSAQGGDQSQQGGQGGGQQGAVGGQNYYVLSYTWAHIGKVKKVTYDEIVLTGEDKNGNIPATDKDVVGKVALVGETKRFGETLAKGELNEAEVVPGDVIITRGPGISIYEWNHPLLTESC